LTMFCLSAIEPCGSGIVDSDSEFRSFARLTFFFVAWTVAGVTAWGGGSCGFGTSCWGSCCCCWNWLESRPYTVDGHTRSSECGLCNGVILPISMMCLGMFGVRWRRTPAKNWKVTVSPGEAVIWFGLNWSCPPCPRVTIWFVAACARDAPRITAEATKVFIVHRVSIRSKKKY